MHHQNTTEQIDIVNTDNETDPVHHESRHVALLVEDRRGSTDEPIGRRNDRENDKKHTKDD